MTRPMRKWLALALTSSIVLFASPDLKAADAPAEDPRRAEAKAHFELGVAHVDRSEWDAALVEFLESRKSLATSKNTYNAAVCLRKMSRFDEALEMYETLLRDFPALDATEKQVAERELAQLKASVGSIELVGGVARAKIVIDGRERGTLPPSGPAPKLAVGAGSHTLRVSADGYLPFEARVDVAGMQTVSVKLDLAALTAGGRLNIAEQTGKALDVVVDNATVGKTPWEGVLAPGEHTVLLRGEGKIGTPPVRPNVTLGQVVSLNLLGEELASSVRIEPQPASAVVSIDGIVLGRGTWEGRLRPGVHQLAATADGFLPLTQRVETLKDKSLVLPATLARDPKAFGQSASLVLEVDAAMPLGMVYGGELVDGCTGACSSGLPIGFHGVLHGAYQTGSGFGGGVDVGYLLALQSISNRDAVLSPKGRADHRGTADDSLRLGGLTLGASGQFQRKGNWPIVFRIGAGVVLGSVTDSRSGRFTNSTGEAYSVSAQTSSAATFFYVAPEVRIGRTIAKNLEINVGAEVLVLAALKKPTWDDATGIVTSNVGRGDGLATFGQQGTTGSLLLLIAPGIGARYEF